MLLGLLLSVSVQATTLYTYELDVRGVKIGPDRDHFTKAVADGIKPLGTCLDLKRDYIPKDPKNAAVINLLTSEPLPQDTINSLVTNLCAGQVASCQVTGSVAQAEMSDLKFAYAYSRTDKRSAAIATTGAFPKFSSSCESGKTDESYFFTARSHESRALIKASGMDMSKLISFALQEKNGAILWVFGRPDLYWNDHPTTDVDQDLAPPSILDKLK